jgi:hypothetical protein
MAFLPALAAIVSIAGTGTGLGLELSGFGKPSTPKAPTTPPAVTALADQQKVNQEKSAISSQVPNLLSETSGLANPDYIAQMAKLISGTGGPGSDQAVKDIIASVFGFPSTTPKFTPAGTGGDTSGAFAATPVQLSDFTNRFIGA